MVLIRKVAAILALAALGGLFITLELDMPRDIELDALHLIVQRDPEATAGAFRTLVESGDARSVPGTAGALVRGGGWQVSRPYSLLAWNERPVGAQPNSMSLLTALPFILAAALSSDSCALDVEPVVKSGWVRWRSADQGPWVWYHTRGC